LRIAVASPFVDRRHGTERALAELLTRLAKSYGHEVHLYAQRVEELEVSRGAVPGLGDGAIFWRRVPSVPGPHLIQFVCWFYLNRLCRAWDGVIHGARFDAVFSPGINCSDADVILVHAVFHRLAQLQRASPARGLRALHQRLYYRFVCRLERRIYTNPGVALAAVSRHTAEQLHRYFGRNDVAVVPNGVDTGFFCPEEVQAMREAARQRRGFRPEEKVLLLIGNDWRNKGLPALLEAMSLCKDLPLRGLVVGQENPADFLEQARKWNVEDRVQFAASEPDVRRFYAAADVLAAPSLEDSFNLPALEAMSCGLPVIVSVNAGISEWIRHGENGLLLQDPQDPRELAETVRALVTSPERMKSLGERAVQTAAGLSWDRHAEEIERLISRRTSTAKLKS
jgi:UDP-glucose:(heptosyl)LPS alpha-1,3-glucosyltransferase